MPRPDVALVMMDSRCDIQQHTDKLNPLLIYSHRLDFVAAIR